MFGSLCRVTVSFIVWIENPKVMLEKYEKYMTGASSKSSLNLLQMKRNMWNVYTIHKWLFSGFCPQNSETFGNHFWKRERSKYDGWSFVTYHYPCWRHQSDRASTVRVFCQYHVYSLGFNRLNVLGFNRLRVLHRIEIFPQALLVMLVTNMIAMFTLPGPTGWAFSTFIPTHDKFPEPGSWKRWRWLNLVFIPTHKNSPNPWVKREEDGRSLCFPVPVGGVFPPSSGKELSVPATQVSSVKIWKGLC